MSELLEITVGVAVVAYVIGRQLIGEPLRGKRVVVLPIILTVIGIADLNGNKQQIKPVDVAFLVLGAVVVAGVGLALGKVTRLESRDGALWGQLPVRGLWLWLLLIVSRLLITAIASGADAKVAASSSTILLMLGINRLAQAAVILPRAMSAGTPFAPERDGRQLFSGLTARPSTASFPSMPTARVVEQRPPDISDDWSDAPDRRPSGPARPAGTDWSTLGRQAGSALADHHRDHEERRQRRRNAHDDRRGRRRDRDNY